MVKYVESLDRGDLGPALQWKNNLLYSGGIDAERQASKIARGLEDIGERSQDRQGTYRSELSRYADPFAQKISQGRERKLIDSLYARALGQDENIGQIESRMIERAAADAFQKNQQPQTSRINPLLAARASQENAKGSLSGSESRSMGLRTEGGMQEKEMALARLDAAIQRDKGLQDELRELKFGEQRESEQLSSELAKNLNQRSQNQINLYNQAQESQRAENAAYANAALGAFGNLFSAILSRSDRRTKKDIKPSGNAIDMVLEKVSPVQFEYKEEYKKLPGGGEGKRIGVLAQDLEDAGLDYAVIMEPGTGMKMVDFGSLVPLLLAAQSRLNEKIDKKKDKKK